LEVLNGHRARLLEKIEGCQAAIGECQAAIDAIDNTIAVIQNKPLNADPIRDAILAEARKGWDEARRD
jgi:hypothetical protein